MSERKEGETMEECIRNMKQMIDKQNKVIQEMKTTITDMNKTSQNHQTVLEFLISVDGENGFLSSDSCIYILTKLLNLDIDRSYKNEHFYANILKI